ncbi:NAD-dependent epimerase/dehydratase family protein [Streptomyces sp. NPDC003857]
MKVVVTGGAGFIGANLCRELISRRSVGRVVALDDLSTGAAANLAGTGAELVEGSILDRDLLEDVVDGADAVVHLAARPSVPRSLADPFATHEVNATGTVRVLEACRRHHTQLVAASSSSVYGSVTALPKHEGLPTRPLSPYAASKLATESYVLSYGHAFGLPALAFRFFNVYGPLQPAGHAYAAVVPSFVDAALRGRPLTVFGDGHQTRDFTYVGTVARSLYPARVGALVAELPPDTVSHTEALVAHGVLFTDADHTIDLAWADADDARLLDCPPGQVLLRERRRTTDPEGVPVEWSEDRYLPGTISFTVHNSVATSTLGRRHRPGTGTAR